MPVASALWVTDQLLCDAQLTAVLFDGKGTLLDANDAAEQWSRKQRRGGPTRTTTPDQPPAMRRPTIAAGTHPAATWEHPTAMSIATGPHRCG